MQLQKSPSAADLPLFKNSSRFDYYFRADFDSFEIGYYAHSFMYEKESPLATTRDFCGLYFNFGGDLHAGLPSGPLQADQFNMIFVPRGHFIPEDGLQTIVLEFKKEYLQKITSLYPLLGSFLQSAEGMPVQMNQAHFPVTDNLRDTLAEVTEQIQSIDDDEEQLSALLNAVIPDLLIVCLELLVASSDPLRDNLPRDHAMILEAYWYIDQNFAERITVADLAYKVGINKDRLESGFRSMFHTSVHDFQISRRIRWGRVYLADSTMTVKEVAARVGYKSRISFSRIFKSRNGITPEEFRAAQKNRKKVSSEIEIQKESFLRHISFTSTNKKNSHTHTRNRNLRLQRYS